MILNRLEFVVMKSPLRRAPQALSRFPESHNLQFVERLCHNGKPGVCVFSQRIKSLVGFVSKTYGVNNPVSDVTRMLDAVERGEPHAAEELLPLVYEELRRLAAQKMAKEQPRQTLQPTALVHEAWIRLIGRPDLHYNGSHHFFLVAAEAMRRILVDNARRKRRLKRGGGQEPLDIEKLEIPVVPADEDLLLVNEALDRFAGQHPEKAEVVQLRYFVGMSYPEVAGVLQISETTVKRYWSYAKAWLCNDIEQQRKQ